MEWVIYYLLGAVLSGCLGFVGGQVALLSDRRRRRVAPVLPSAVTEFRLEHLDGLTWSLVNVGGAPGALVRLLPFGDGLEQWPPQAVPGQLETATSKLLPTLHPGDSMSVWLSRYDAGQKVIVSWTSDENVRMGPVKLDVPPPR
ncbi:MAG TPA: hypothetical protein VGC37_07245 [Friedmanniella sp.]